MNASEMATRDKLLTVRMTAEEMLQLEELSKLTRLSGSDLVRKLLQDELGRVRREEESERRRRERYWALDKERVRRMIRLSRVLGLQASFSDEKQTIVLTDGKHTEPVDSADEAGIIIMQWPGSRLVAWSMEHPGLAIVAKTKAAREKANEVKEPANMADEEWEKLGCEFVKVD